VADQNDTMTDSAPDPAIDSAVDSAVADPAADSAGSPGAAPRSLDALVESWLTLPDVAERLGIDVGKVRRLLQDGALVAVRQGERSILSIPEAFLVDGVDGVDGIDGPQPLPELRGTLSVLRDAGHDDEAAVRWLFTPDDTLPGSPVEAMRAGRKTEIRRRAQALAF
jgi:excisionase family DNA binding protein